MSTQTAPHASKLLQTAAALVAAYNAWDIDAILVVRAPQCTQQVLPYRLNRPVLNNEDYRNYFSSIMPLFNGFTLEILESVVDETNNKVALLARSTAETPIGPYSNEYMIFLQMTADQEKIECVKEFVDSGFSDDYFRRLAAWKASQASGTEN